LRYLKSLPNNLLGEQSPSGSINISSNLKKINPIAISNNNSNATNNTSSAIVINQIQHPKPPVTSSLDQFFESLNVEELGSTKTSTSDEHATLKSTAESNESLKKTPSDSTVKEKNYNLNNQISQIESKQIEYISAQLKLDTFKSKEAFLKHEKNKELKNCAVEPVENNLTETAANHEMSLKNSAELLKQISSIGKMEHLQQLEQQMQQSMQLIEKLKSASQNSISSQTPPPAPPPPLLLSSQKFVVLNNRINDLNRTMTNSSEENLSKQKSNDGSQGTFKLRSINSMPSNLKELEALIQNQQVAIESQSRFQNQNQSKKQQHQM